MPVGCWIESGEGSLSSGIIPFMQSREHAIRAWKLEGYTPLDELEAEYGITHEYLFRAGLLIKTDIWSDRPGFRPYRLSERGRRLMAEVEELSLILIRPECLAKLFLICMAETVGSHIGGIHHA